MFDEIYHITQFTMLIRFPPQYPLIVRVTVG
jgi:hypothetical protein